jgi:D-alanine-D-alanine ligase
MRIAFTHNLRLSDSEDEAEFDSAETVDAIAAGLRAGGHEVEKIEVTGPASRLAERIESFSPDLIFNTAEGRRGRAREAFYPALFEELGFPYTGSDAYVLTLTLDKWLTKLVLAQKGIDTPRGRLVTPEEYRRTRDPGTLGLALPVIVKPNYEGSSKGIGDDAVVRDARALAEVLPQALRAYPNGVLVEEFVAGTDVTVPLLEGRGDEGVLLPVDYLVDPSAKSRFNLYDYRLKSAEANKVSVRCPPDLPRDVVSRLRAITKMAARALGIRDLGRIDFRVGEDGRLYLLEVNALPSLEPGASLYAAAAREGLDYGETLHAIVESAALRQGLVVKPGARRRRPADPLRIGFAFNVKRVDPKAGNDAEAEYDAPETIDAIREALEGYGHVTLFEATADLPRQLMQTPVDLVFNIAEGVAGRRPAENSCTYSSDFRPSSLAFRTKSSRPESEDAGAARATSVSAGTAPRRRSLALSATLAGPLRQAVTSADRASWGLPSSRQTLSRSRSNSVRVGRSFQANSKCSVANFSSPRCSARRASSSCPDH